MPDIQDTIQKGREFLEALTHWDGTESDAHKELFRVAFKVHAEVDDTEHPDKWGDPKPEPTHQDVPSWLMALVNAAEQYEHVLLTDDPQNGFIGFTFVNTSSDPDGEETATWLTVKISQVKLWFELTSMTDDPMWIPGVHATMNRLGTPQQVTEWLKSPTGRQEMAKSLVKLA